LDGGIGVDGDVERGGDFLGVKFIEDIAHGFEGVRVTGVEEVEAAIGEGYGVGGVIGEVEGVEDEFVVGGLHGWIRRMLSGSWIRPMGLRKGVWAVERSSIAA
jgi:hypothetical protein